MGKLCSKPLIDEEFVSLGVKQSTDVNIRGYLMVVCFFNVSIYREYCSQLPNIFQRGGSSNNQI